jgi:CheY-like chemotaxis protein
MQLFERLKRLVGLGSRQEARMPVGSERLETTWGSESAVDNVPAAAVQTQGPPKGRERRSRARRPVDPNTRILIIDDSATIVATLRKMIRQSGLATLDAADAERGIEIAQAEVPDLIFLDIVLPGMNGFSALRQLRRDPRTSAIPVIMISGNAQATEEFYVQRIGADDFMKKPFSRAEIFARIERLLDEQGKPRRITDLARLRGAAGRDEEEE